MNKRILLSLAGATLLGGFGASAALAQAVVPDHPRVNEVNQRIDNQQDRIQQGVNNGTINAQQELRDEKSLTNKEQRLSADEAAHGGHITKAEQRRLNRGLNRNSRRIHRQKTTTSGTSGGSTTTTPAAPTNP